METIIQGGTIINEGRTFRGDIVLEDDHIAALYEAEKAPRGIYQQTVDASGCFVFPGIIDAHVHFREPGLTRKADILLRIWRCPTPHLRPQLPRLGRRK